MRKFNLTILFLLALLPVLFAGQTDLENGDRGEAIYYMEKETYVR